MEDRELEARLTDLESDRVERTEASKDGTKIGQAICAFSNDLPGHGEPGVLFVGVKDDGNCERLTTTDEPSRSPPAHRDDRVTAYMQNGRRLEVAQWRVSHEPLRDDAISLDEVAI